MTWNGWGTGVRGTWCRLLPAACLLVDLSCAARVTAPKPAPVPMPETAPVPLPVPEIHPAPASLPPPPPPRPSPPEPIPPPPPPSFTDLKDSTGGGGSAGGPRTRRPPASRPPSGKAPSKAGETAAKPPVRMDEALPPGSGMPPGNLIGAPEEPATPAWATAYLAAVPLTRTPRIALGPVPLDLDPETPERTPRAGATESLVGPDATKNADLARLAAQLKALPASAWLARARVELDLGRLLADLGRPGPALQHLARAQALLGNRPQARALRHQVLRTQLTILLDAGASAALDKAAGLLPPLRTSAAALPSPARALAEVDHAEGTLLLRRGRAEAARKAFQKALEAFARDPRKQDEAESAAWNALGQLEQALGLVEAADRAYRKALQRMGTGPAWDEARGVVTLNLGAALQAQGRSAEAATVQASALALFRARGLPLREAAALNGLALSKLDLGQTEPARGLLLEALALYGRLGLEEGELRTLLNLAQAERRLQRLPQRLGCLLEARGLAARVEAPWVQVLVAHELMALWAEAGRRDLAILEGKAAARGLQALEADLGGLDLTQRRAFLLAHEATLRGLSDLLVGAGRLSEAQRVVAVLKDVELRTPLRDALRGGGPTVAAPSPTEVERAQAPAYQKAQARMTGLGWDLAQLRRKARAAGGQLDEGDQAELDRLNAQMTEARRAFRTFLRGLETQPGAPRPPADLRDTEALKATLEDLGHGAVALHYLQGADKLHILVTTSATQVARSVPVTPEALNQAIAAFRSALAERRGDPKMVGRRLYDLLLAPVAEDLAQARARTLMVSLDGALRYVPFAALWDGERYAVERWAFALLTEAAKDKLKDPPVAGRALLGFGLSQAHPGFEALPAVPQELAAVGAVLPGPTHLNRAFTLRALEQGLLAQPQVLHLSSHFVYRPESDTASFLLLGDGSRLSLAEVEDAPWSLGSVELLTLSACETAVGGGRDAEGREVEGLGARLQRKGAKGVLATLWPVADASTGAFMADLYRRWKKSPGLTKGEALRQTQLALLRGELKGGGPSASKGTTLEQEGEAAPASPWSHPFHWAPFILMGNWR